MARRTVLVNGGVAVGILVFGVAVARTARDSLRQAAEQLQAASAELASHRAG